MCSESASSPGAFPCNVHGGHSPSLELRATYSCSLLLLTRSRARALCASEACDLVLLLSGHRCNPGPRPFRCPGACACRQRPCRPGA
eukprot:3096258-Pyramimonas_sp.AAC.1